MPKKPKTPFQYHTGSIKSCFLRQQITVRAAFQYHTGSIKRLTSPKLTGACKILFQYHTGSIKRANFRWGKPHLPLVSIPHWFD